MYLVLVFSVFLILAIIGMPLAVAMGLTSFLFLCLDAGQPLAVQAQKIFAGVDSFPLMAIPFFVLAGGLMNGGGLTGRIIAFTNTCVGHRPGSLGRVSVLSNIFFGAISGSAVAATSALGSVLIPSMIKEKYPPALASALIAISSALAPIIPPSISMIMYGIVTGTSIKDLFLGGAIPGILFGIVILFMIGRTATRRNLPKYKKSTSHERITSLKRVIWALLLPFIVFGGILSGIFTVTESAAVTALYAFVVGVFIHRELNSFRSICSVLKDSAISVSVVMFLIAASKPYSYLLAINQIPNLVSAEVLAITTDPYLILFLMNVIFLVIGMFMETNSAIVIFMPIFYPLITRLGIDPVHFGVVICFNLALGLVTPPFGICLSMASKMAETPLLSSLKEVIPYLIAGIGVLFLITYVPEIILFLPRNF